MVVSNINNTIKYEETKAIASNDIDVESSIYSAKIYDKTIQFVLGLAQFEHKSNNIVYFNIYLANNGFVIAKIGIYETYNNIYSTLLDEDGDIDLSKMSEPLLFSFAKSLIGSLPTDTSLLSEDEDEEDEDEEDEDEEDNVDNDKGKTIAVLPTKPTFDIMALASQTKEESDYEISKYVEDPTHNWVNKYLKSVKSFVKSSKQNCKWKSFVICIKFVL
jgi:hypothetical protein